MKVKYETDFKVVSGYDALEIRVNHSQASFTVEY